MQMLYLQNRLVVTPLEFKYFFASFVFVCQSGANGNNCVDCGSVNDSDLIFVSRSLKVRMLAFVFMMCL